MDDYAVFHDYNTLINHCINNNKSIAQPWDNINNECVELRHTADVDMILQSEYLSDISAVFIAANDRVRLYKKMEWLDLSPLANCDTDSVIVLYGETNPKPQ